VHYGPNLARPNSQLVGSGAEGLALPRFRPSPMGRPARLEPSWGRGKSPSLACSRRPSMAPGRFWHIGGEVRWGGLHGNKAVRWLRFGVKRGRGSPGDTLHSGGDSKMGAGGGSSDQRSRHPAAGSGSCVALPQLGEVCFGADIGWRCSSTARCFPQQGRMVPTLE
jgi:hypothetical protein